MKIFKYAVLICTTMMSGFMLTACSEDETSENGGSGNSEANSKLYTTRPTEGAGFIASYDEKGVLTDYRDSEGLLWEVVSTNPLKLKSYESYGDETESYEATFNQNKNGIITSGKVVCKWLYPEYDEEETETISLNFSYNKAGQLEKVSLSYTDKETSEGRTETVSNVKGTTTLTYSDGRLIKATANYNGTDEGSKFNSKGTATYSYENGVDNKMKQFGFSVLYTAVPTFNLEMFAPLFEIGMFGAPSVQLPSETLLSLNESYEEEDENWSEQEELDVSYVMNEDGTIKTEKVFCEYSGDDYQYTDNATFNYSYWNSPINYQTIKQDFPKKAKRTRGFFKFPRTKRTAL